MLDALDLPPFATGLLRADGPGSALLPQVRLDGLDTMRFSTEVLPLLADADGVVVEVDGAPAVYRETGDLLQVGVSTAESDAGTDWFDLGIRISVEGRDVPFADVFAALAAGESHLLLPDGAYFSLQKPELQALRTLIEEARALQDSPSGPLRLSRFQAGLWDELAALGVVDAQARAWQQQVTGLLADDGPAATPVPAGLRAQLRPYQRDGFDWLCYLWRHGLGGVLADDMGLGKTVQALALICHAREVEPGGAPFLIVAPTSVVPNWAAEAARFSPGLRVVTVTDTLRRRGQELAEVIAGADVVVTSYTLFRLDADGLRRGRVVGARPRRGAVREEPPDEGPPVRAPAAGAVQAGDHRDADGEQPDGAVVAAVDHGPGAVPEPDAVPRDVRPADRARPRRRGAGPAAAPDPAARAAADQGAGGPRPASPSRSRSSWWSSTRGTGGSTSGTCSASGRRCSGSSTTSTATGSRSCARSRCCAASACIPALIADEHAQLGSAKVDTLLEQLSEVVDGGHRALVFSQFTSFLALVRERLDAAGVAYCYLDGSSRDRAAIVDRFHDGTAPVFLISLKAGGFGLNLTEADYCFLLDPWWNPATEAQAVDRTHRIGQTRNVMVYRLIARDTIEEKVLALAKRKAALFAGVMDDGDSFGTALTADDIRALVS